MEKFNFNIDRKCTIWVKEYHQIEAEDYSEARRIIMENFRLNATDNTFTMQDVQHDTLKDLSVAENSGWATAELINPEGDTIADNTI